MFNSYATKIFMRYLPIALIFLFTACPKKEVNTEPDVVIVSSPDVAVANRPDVSDDGYPRPPKIDFDTLREALPKDENGNAILSDRGEFKLSLRATPKPPSPSTAFGACTGLVTGCVGITRDRDDCVRRVPRCTSETHWLEAPCCPDQCAEFYFEERRLGASPLEAHIATFSSDHECYPELQEWYRSNGGTPYLAPRRQPLP